MTCLWLQYADVPAVKWKHRRLVIFNWRLCAAVSSRLCADASRTRGRRLVSATSLSRHATSVEAPAAADVSSYRLDSDCQTADVIVGSAASACFA